MNTRKNKKKKQMESRTRPALITSSRSFGYVESYKTLRTNLIYAADSMGAKCKVIMLTSSVTSEGKSSVSINLAIALSQANKKVILLDCDLRKKTLYSYLRISRQQVGLSDFLQEDADSRMKVIFRYDELGIDVLFAGSTPPNPSELLGSPRMGRLLRTLSEQYDFVICDTPPLGVVSDALALGRFVDGAILVASYDKVLRQDAIASKQKLENSNIPILGSILNMYDAKDAVTSGRKGYGYGYGYGYDSYYGYGDYDNISENASRGVSSSIGQNTKKTSSSAQGGSHSSSTSGGSSAHGSARDGAGTQSAGRSGGAATGRSGEESARGRRTESQTGARPS